jgi:hypothetical protein
MKKLSTAKCVNVGTSKPDGRGRILTFRDYRFTSPMPLENNETSLWKLIIADDETRMHHATPQTKQTGMHRKHPASPTAKEFSV